MTRKIITQLLADIAAAIPNNNTQEISALDVRQSFIDAVESVTPLLARNSGNNSPGIAVALTTVPQKLPVSIYTSSQSGNPAVLEARGGLNGDLLCKTGVGRLQALFAVTMIAPSGADIVFTMAQNGVVIAPRPVITGRGSGNPVSAEFSWLFSALADNDTFDIWAYGLTTSPNITLQMMNLQGVLLPQYVA